MIKTVLERMWPVLSKICWCYNSILLWNSRKYVKKMKEYHKGKRCFIVGNGPSLQVDDLKELKDEISFGTHRIYTLFDKTDWRPSYYCAQDARLIKSSMKKILELAVKEKLIAIVRSNYYRPMKKVKYIELNNASFYPDLPKFSEDITKGVYEGFTVTYMCIQIAMYMGFSEIYLLGMDHNYSVEVMPDGKIKKNEGVQDHFSESDVIENIPQIYKSTLAYESAKKYAENKGVKIYNASRGGKLEIFERVNFDEIIKN